MGPILEVEMGGRSITHDLRNKGALVPGYIDGSRAVCRIGLSYST